MVGKILLTLFMVVSVSTISSADTIYLNNGEEVKGLVVDNFADRVVVSTASGEINIMKADIKDIRYDTVEQTYFQLGKEYEKRTKYKEAIDCYENALKANPDYTEAKNALTLVRITYWKQDQNQLQNAMQKKKALMNYRKKGPVVKKKPLDKKELLKRRFGITLDEMDGWPRVASVLKFELGDEIKKGDIIVAIWGKQTRYSRLDGVINELLKSNLRETNITIERVVQLAGDKYPSSIADYGFALTMELDGLTVKEVIAQGNAQRSGLRNSDMLTAINGSPTRYMPLNEAVKVINTSKEPVTLTIRRSIFLLRRD